MLSLTDIVELIGRLLPEPQAGLLSGMLFGVRQTIPQDFYESLVITSTLHVVSLSGMNISIIVKTLFDGLGSYIGKRWGSVSTLIIIVLFVLFVGPSPSIIRASIMGALTMIATLFGRKDIPLLSLVFTVLAMLIFDNSIFSSISFQLSVGATLGILLFSKTNSTTKTTTFVKNSKNGDQTAVNSRIRASLVALYSFVMSVLKENFRVTVAAQLFTVPLILFHFHRVSLIGTVANCFIGWLIAPITYLGFVTVFLALLFEPIGRLAALVVYVPLTIFIGIVRLFSSVPYASVGF